jgi:hypothetical protein
LRPHTPVDTAAKKDVKNAGEKLVRSFVNRYLRYPPVTDGDRIAMGIPNRRGWRTHLQAPGSRPEFGLFVKDIRCIGIRFWDKERSTRAKPHGAAGALICWAILDAPPKSIKDLVFSELATRTPYFLRFDDADRGKWVYIALRWQNTKGEKGPSSGIKSTVVP